jgi:ribosome biogenesis GTPase
MIKGRVLRLTGGFYYVKTPDGVIECRARGLLRREGISPCAGDMALVEPTGPSTGRLLDILPRKNALVRPPVANVDRLLLVLAAADPAPNLMVADRQLAIAQHKDIPAAVVITKSDLADAGAIAALYAAAGYEVACVNSLSGEVQAVRRLIEGNLCVLCGNSGVGKSTLLNALSPSLALPTAQTSRKLGRGRHTTRVTELFEVCGGMVADTPGFSSLETGQAGFIRKEDLQWCFIEFAPHIGSCRFTGCSHTGEKGCAVLEAVRAGQIAPSRHRSYLAMYHEARQIKDWELKP